MKAKRFQAWHSAKAIKNYNNDIDSTGNWYNYCNCDYNDYSCVQQQRQRHNNIYNDDDNNNNNIDNDDDVNNYDNDVDTDDDNDTKINNDNAGKADKMF